MDPHQLVRDTRASGDDSALRVYADWLEQQGDPERAQLVHLQCELARLDPLDRRTFELRWELELLLARHGDRWRAELPALPGVTWAEFEYGFASCVQVFDLGALARVADAIAAAAPVIRAELPTIDASPDLEISWLVALRVGQTLVNATLPATVHELEVSSPNDALEWLGRASRGSLERLAISPSLVAGRELVEMLAAAAPSLRSLAIPTRYLADDSGYVDDPTLRAEDVPSLAKLRRLERLTIDRHRFGSAGVTKLVAALPTLRALSARECHCNKLAFGDGTPLVELDLSRNAIGSTGAQVIARARRCAELRELVLDTCEIESLGLSELIASPLWHTLRRLDLSRNPLGASAIRALAAAPAPSQLHTLVLADADLDDTAGTALGKIAWLGNLAVLDLSGNMLGRGAAGLRAIVPDAVRRLGLASIGLERAEAAAIARFWPRVIDLDLSGNAFTDAGLERFATMKEAAALQRLGLRDCALTDDGLELLAAARCPRLRVLDLSGNRFGAALVPLLHAPFVRELETLDLSRCTLPMATVAALATIPMPPRLRQLNLRGHDLDEATLLALAESPSLRAVSTIELDGNPWTFAEAARARIAARFGATWYQH